ncbi:MAG: hypothetical protein DCF16_10970 [Alphaproteobacteria bacterium]|nr:MAG: hypothetical protein DCF16_10970 [Alphaproteobacteria bacterium]
MNWFSDLQFHWDASITVRKSGRRITLRDLTAGELTKFFGYFGVLLVQAAAARMSGKKRYRVCFTPDRPRPWYVVWSAATLAGVKIVRDADSADAVFYFEDVTIGAPPRFEGRRVLNAGVADISKTTVAEAFGKVAGYDLLIDPAKHVGPAVEKSEANGAHDGRLVHCPTPAQPGKSYQLFIDSSDGDTAFDYRTTIINRKPRFVLVKTKPASDRFSIHNETVVMQPLGAVFTAAEIDIIARFAQRMQLDWAALDVLRDQASQKIYIVDVNKTDTGPAVDLSLKDREALKRDIAAAFREMLEEHPDLDVKAATPG